MPKIKALEAQITPNCTRIHGKEKAVEIAISRARTIILDCLESLPEGTFTVEVHRLIPGPPPPKNERKEYE